MRRARIGVDIGGTFTDLVLLDTEGQVFFAKVSSTPAAPEEAVLTGVAQILGQAGLGVADVAEVLHGTTVGSNTLLQKVGAKTGLITTKGFRDVLEIGRVRTPTMFDLTWSKAEPLVARHYRREVDERITATGEVLKPLNPAEIIAIGEDFRADGIESVAICFLNSYRNPENERVALETFAAHFPDIWVTASISVLPEIKEYERTSTTAVNAYVLPSLRHYLTRLEGGLQAMGVVAPLLVSNSNGGLSTAKIAQEKPVFFISSGRSAGVVGGARLAASINEPDLVVFDMGGTTASASLVHKGEVTRTSEYEFRSGISTPSRFIKADGYLMRVPTIDVAEVGSGAGSIAWLDSGNLLNAGPQSAGAFPGPACYGLGGDKPTVTDANVALGFLPPVLAGGSMKLDVQRSRDAIQRDIAGPLGLTVEEAALGIREIVNVNMARAIRAVTVERGVDPRDFTLLAFGGSGPVHACDLARALDIRRVLFPRAPGVFTAMGMLAGHVERYFLRPLHGLLRNADGAELAAAAATLRAEATEALAQEGYGPEAIACEFELDLRYRGQDSELQIAFDDKAAFDPERLRQAFLAAYRATYGYASADEVEIVNLRLRAQGLSGQSLDFTALKSDQLTAGTLSLGTRPIHFSREAGWVDTPVVARAALTGPMAGPVVLQSSDTTIIVPPDAMAAPDVAGNVVVTFSAGPEKGQAMTQHKIDPVTFAVIKSGLDTIVDDMAYAVMRTARSSIVRDVLDYSVTMCDATGRILSQAKTVALHLGAVPDAMEVVLRLFADDLFPGDVVVLNDPYEGGMHLPDIFMFKPIFVQDSLQGFSVVVAHHTDVGGRVPGSNASDSTEIYQEGIRIAPMKLYDRGVPKKTLLKIIEKNVRLPDLVIGDLEVQYATCNIGEREFLKLAARYGVAPLNAYFDALIDYGERLTRAAISSWADGDYHFEDVIDGDGFSDDPILIKVCISVVGDHLKVSFDGSAPQVRGAINSTLSFVKSATYLSVRCALDRDVPNNAGVYRCVDVTAPEGSILNPAMPAAVAARALTGYRVVDTVLGALAQIAPTRIMAAGEGGNTVVALGGYDAETREPFVLVDMINGAWGGRAHRDGVEGVTNPSQNMSNLPIETIEARYPVMMEEYSLRPDSCGAGKYRGGLGLTRQYRLLAKEAMLQMRADRYVTAPYGLFGGSVGEKSRNILNPDHAPEALPSKLTRQVQAGTVIRHEQAGAGGYGNPLERDMALIARDLRDAKITRAFAERHYKAVFDAAGAFDPAATLAARG